MEIAADSDPQAGAAGPASPADMLVRADLLAARGEPDDALRIWAALRADQARPLAAAWLRAARLLGTLRRLAEADAIWDDARHRFPHQLGIWLDWATNARERRDWPEALRRWQEVGRRFPDQARGYLGAAATHRDAGQAEVAEALLREAMQRFPDDPGPAIEFAMHAQHARRWAQARDRWADVQKRFPDRVSGPIGLALALRSLGRPDEAEAVLADARQRFPDDFAPVMESGSLAHFRRDWPTAARRWAEVRAVAPALSAGYVFGALALRELARADEAAALLRSAVARFPQDLQCYLALARLSVAAGDWDEAERCWNDVTLRFPNAPEGPIGKAAALCRRGQSAAADAVIGPAMRRFADNASLAEQFGLNAMAREDWALALARLEAAQHHFPASDSIRASIGTVRQRLPEAMPEAATDIGQDGTVVMAFESLGGTGHGCEFGIFQRNFGVEPLGLLRWADMQPQGLIAALETEFVGFGEPEFTRIFVPPTTGRPEYWFGEIRYGMVTRCFVYPDEVPLERMSRLVHQRMRFLARKLVEDLQGGVKIFTYKNMQRNLTATELARLHAAVRKYGDNTLFCIRYQDVDHAGGTVEVRGPGLMLGYIDRFSHTADTNEFVGPVHQQLLALCRRAYALWRAGRTQRAPPADDAA